jgi:hypothetical protein
MVRAVFKGLCKLLKIDDSHKRRENKEISYVKQDLLIRFYKTSTYKAVNLTNKKIEFYIELEATTDGCENILEIRTGTYCTASVKKFLADMTLENTVMQRAKKLLATRFVESENPAESQLLIPYEPDEQDQVAELMYEFFKNIPKSDPYLPQSKNPQKKKNEPDFEKYFS